MEWAYCFPQQVLFLFVQWQTFSFSMTTKTADFFISYTRADTQWAEWVAWTLEEAGFSTRIQAWDFKAGKNFVQLMDEATRLSKRTIAIISDSYFASDFGKSEWYAAYARDPEGKDRRLIPVRVSECDIEGLLSQVICVDVVGADEEAARRRLISAATDKRAKPPGKPFFRGATSKKPKFPGPSVEIETRGTEDSKEAQTGVGTDLVSFACAYCGASGKSPYAPAPSPICNGRGEVKMPIVDRMQCRYCGGEGKDPFEPVPCKGFGFVNR